MPVSKNGRTYFTVAQLREARSCSALEYAKSAGYNLVKDGRGYHLKEHDSMIFTRDGRWFWNSQGLKGRAPDFLVHYEGMSLPEAVNRLTVGYGSAVQRAPPSRRLPLRPHLSTQGKKPFELPEKSPTFKRLFAYLCQTRNLDVEIVQELVEQHRIYESVRCYPAPGTGELREAHNVVFVGFDETGKPKSAFQRGTNTYGAVFKRDVGGSDKTYAFCCPGREGVTAVSVFEASIDAISHATLAKHSGEDWRSRDRIAQGGTWEGPLLHYLQCHPNVKEIELCYDNDEGGHKAAARTLEALEKEGFTAENGYLVTVSFPELKDWNEDLVSLDQI